MGGNGGAKPSLVEFKAGRMNYDGRMVTPDRRKGLLRIVVDAASGGIKTFQWCDESKTPIESFYVFPDEAKFEKVKQSADRVYLLEMKQTKQRYFYWMQVSNIHI
jgi:26S proteasome regulatory subunit N13